MMKSSVSFVSTVLLFLFFSGVVFAQPNGTASSTKTSQEDSLKCLQQLSVASLALEKEMYNHAIKPWRSLFYNCPDLSVRIYSDGVKLFEHFAENSKNEDNRQAYLDTLLMIYDQRIEYFGDHKRYSEGWILGRKGMSIVKYQRGNVSALSKAYNCFQRSYSLLGEETEPAVMIAWIQTSRVLGSEGQIPGDQFLEDYVTVYSHIVNDNFKEKYNDRVYSKIISAVRKIFNQADHFNCQTFSHILKNENSIDGIDANTLRVYLDIMDMAGCKDSDLYSDLLEREYQINPSAESAVALARKFIKQGIFNRAANYYEEAIERAKNDSLKAVFYYKLAVLKDGHFKEAVEARQYAKRASALLPGWGKPYLLLGGIYARAFPNLEGNELEKNAVYWAAVDQFRLAMKKDIDCSEEAQKQIEVYSQYFPDKQTCFFHGLDEGQEFVVGDWINEPTKVRFR